MCSFKFLLTELHLCQKKNVCGINLLTIDQLQLYHELQKFFKNCIVKRLRKYVKLHDLQFGFTNGDGCYKALLVFYTDVEYFNKYCSTVYVSALNLTKADDRLNQCVIILKLYDIGIPKDIIMILLFWFKNVCAAVVRGNVKSSVFAIKSGVRQGGVRLVGCLICMLIS